MATSSHFNELPAIFMPKSRSLRCSVASALSEIAKDWRLVFSYPCKTFQVEGLRKDCVKSRNRAKPKLFSQEKVPPKPAQETGNCSAR